MFLVSFAGGSGSQQTLSFSGGSGSQQTQQSQLSGGALGKRDSFQIALPVGDHISPPFRLEGLSVGLVLLLAPHRAAPSSQPLFRVLFCE